MGTRILAIDPGATRIGLALSDEGRQLATPLGTLAAGPGAAARVAALAAEHGAGMILVGLPRGLDGTEGAAAAGARALAAGVARDSSLPVEMWDERFTSVIAERGMREAGAHRAPARRGGSGRRGPDAAAVRARREAVDRNAAAVLLQSYLDRPGRPERTPD